MDGEKSYPRGSIEDYPQPRVAGPIQSEILGIRDRAAQLDKMCGVLNELLGPVLKSMDVCDEGEMKPPNLDKVPPMAEELYFLNVALGNIHRQLTTLADRISI